MRKAKKLEGEYRANTGIRHPKFILGGLQIRGRI